jgi:hypothetical protein
MVRATLFLALIPLVAHAELDADAGGPYEVDAEGSVTLDGSSSTIDGFCHTGTYKWDIDDDGEWDLEGATPVFTAAGIDGPDVVPTVKLEVGGWCPAWPEYVSDTTLIYVNNVPPVLDGIEAPTTVVEGTAATFVATAWDAEAADVLTFTWHDGQSGDSADSAFDDDGIVSITATVKDDDGGTDSLEVDVTVTNADPVIEGRPEDRATVGELWTFEPTVVDPGVLDTHDWSGSLPDSVSLDDETGALSWTPSVNDVGIQTLSLTATDDDGGVGTLEFTVAVVGAGEGGDLDGDGTPDGQVAIEDEGGCGCNNGAAIGWLAGLLPLLAVRRRS